MVRLASRSITHAAPRSPSPPPKKLTPDQKTTVAVDSEVRRPLAIENRHIAIRRTPSSCGMPPSSLSGEPAQAPLQQNLGPSRFPSHRGRKEASRRHCPAPARLAPIFLSLLRHCPPIIRTLLSHFIKVAKLYRFRGLAPRIFRLPDARPVLPMRAMDVALRRRFVHTIRFDLFNHAASVVELRRALMQRAAFASISDVFRFIIVDRPCRLGPRAVHRHALAPERRQWRPARSPTARPPRPAAFATSISRA